MYKIRSRNEEYANLAIVNSNMLEILPSSHLSIYNKTPEASSLLTLRQQLKTIPLWLSMLHSEKKHISWRGKSAVLVTKHYDETHEKILNL